MCRTLRRYHPPASFPLVFAAALVLVCTAVNVRSATPGPAVVVQYHQPTDLFTLLDNLSNWLPGYTSDAYAADWEKRFGFTPADRDLLHAYAAFRMRTSPAAKQDDGADPPSVLIPPDAREVDPFTLHFLEAENFGAGEAAAIRSQARGDRAMLQRYFARFGPRAATLIPRDTAFKRQRGTLTSELAKTQLTPFVDQMRRFYGVVPAAGFKARFAWWPDKDSTQAKVRGRYILLQSNPDGTGTTDWAPIVMHEFAHYLSAGKTQDDRSRLSTAFLSACPAALQLRNPLNAFEEPLAIYWGQYRFAHSVQDTALSTDGAWYVQPDADRIAKAIARAFPAGGPAPSMEDPRLMSVAAGACSERAVK